MAVRNAASGDVIRGGHFAPSRLSLDPQYHALVWKGQRIYISAIGDPEEFLFLGSEESDGSRTGGSQQQIIDAMIAGNVNGCYFHLCMSPGDGNADYTLWLGDDPQNNPTTFKVGLIAQLQDYLSQMREADIIPFVFIWDDHDSVGNQVYPGGDTVPALEKAYLEAVSDIIAPYGNVVLMIGEECREGFSNQRVRNQAAIIAARHPDIILGTHQNDGRNNEFSDDPNIRVIGLQLNSKTADQRYDDIKFAYDAEQGNTYKAVIAGLEYGQLPDGANKGQDRRFDEYSTFLGGGAAYASYEVFINGYDAIDLPELVAQGISQQFMNIADPIRLAANDADLINGDRMRTDGNDYLVWTKNLTAPVEISNMVAGTYNLLWQSCDSTDTAIQNSVVVTNGTNTFSRPGTVSNECAVYLERQ